jgi:protoporphyrinogen oxidase
MITIIGAGIAGLTCAKYLKDQGVDALILEASDGVGGRVRTDIVDGFKLDRGFQVFLTSYPEAQNLLDYDALSLKNLPSGARIRKGGEFFLMPNPLKDIWTAPQALFSPVGSLFDKLKVLQLSTETRSAGEPDRTGSNQTTIAFLREFGYSDTMIDRFFIPFLRGVFLEKDLQTSSAFFKFLYGRFATGDVAVPSSGMQAIPEQVAGHLSLQQIRLNTPVRNIEGRTLFLESGEKLEAEKIILATEAAVAARLLAEEQKIEFNGTTCFYFETDSLLEFAAEPYLMINSNTDELIDHLLVLSAAVPGYAPSGKTLVSVNIVGNTEVSEEDIKIELAAWFGREIAWRHLRTYKIPHALPRYFPDSAVESNLRINDFIYRCGDYTAYPSLNAAMKTGREVAEMIIAGR